jgi:3-oxo-5-alpha-steroid 4-dehydrogenase 3
LILGIGHYLLVTLSIIADPDAIFMDRLMQPVNLIVLASGFLLFIYSSYHQHQCNNILAEIKRSNDFQYAIPQGDWFEFVICPHYAAEILLYFSFVMMTSGRNYTIWIIFIWVSINQSISAKMTSDWYQNKFRDCGPVARYKLVPFIW